MATTRRVALLLAFALAFAPAFGAEAQGARAQWWGPTGMNEGWHVRVPVSVNNSGTFSLFNVTAGHDIFLGDLLTAAGWPSRPGNASQPASFALDERSVRVVEYRALGTGSALDGVLVGPVPAKAYLGAFAARRAFDNATQPDLHVDWLVPGELKSNSTRYFYVYLDGVANGPKDAPEAAPALDGRYWIARGTTLYGKAKTLVLLGLENDTTVDVHVYENGKPRPLAVTRGSGSSGGVTLAKGEEVTVSIGDAPALVRVKSSLPVAAAGTSSSATVTGPLASADGGLLGRTFVLPAQTPGFTIYRPTGSSVVTLDTGAGRALDPGTPVWVFLGDGATHTLRATEPVMVFAWPNEESAVPLVTPEGGPLGPVLFGRPYGGHLWVGGFRPTPGEAPCTVTLLELSPGKTTLYTPDGRAYYRGLNPLSGEVLYPQAAGRVAAKAGELLSKPVSFQTVHDHGCPLAFYSTGSATSDEPLGAARLGGFAGRDIAVPSGPLGLVNATDADIYWPATIVAPYNDTLLTLRSGGVVETRGLDAGGVTDVLGSADAPVKLHASKPVFALHPGSGTAFVGLDESLRVERLGPAEFRGYLIELKPADGKGAPLVSVGSPGKPTTYRFALRNLARDTLGAPAPDQVQLTTDAVPPGWEAKLSDDVVALAGGAQKIVTLTVTPPPDADEGARLTLAVHATSLGNPKLSSSVSTVTILRVAYGVDLWFEREGGPKQDTFTLDPGATKDVQVVVKNLATVPDRIVVAATALSSDWGVGIEGLPGSIAEVELEPGATATLALRVRAPPGGASQSVLQVGASSAADAAVSSQLVAALRTRAHVEIALEATPPVLEAQPGFPANFTFALRNRGNDSISVEWNVQAHLPEGWGPVKTIVGGYDLREASGIPARSDLNITVVVPVPANATRGDLQTIGLALQTIPQLAGDAVKSETESVRVLVAARHDLAPSAQRDVIDVGADGAALATIRLENRGNGAENLSLYPDVLPPNTSIVTPGVLALAVGEAKAVQAQLTIALRTPPGLYPVKMRILADDGAPTYWNFSLRLPAIARAGLASGSPTVSVAGEDREARVVVTNEGNVPLPLPPRLAAPEGWTLGWGAQSGTLEPGRSITTTLTVSAPSGAEPGEFVLSPDPAWAGGEGLPWTLRTVKLEADKTLRPGFVDVRVTNAGTGDAVDVDVSVYQSDRRVDTFVVPRIPPGGAVNATLALPPGGGPAELRIDGDARFGPSVTDALDVQASQTPGAGALGLLLVGAGVAVVTRRRAGG